MITLGDGKEYRPGQYVWYLHYIIDYFEPKLGKPIGTSYDDGSEMWFLQLKSEEVSSDWCFNKKKECEDLCEAENIIIIGRENAEAYYLANLPSEYRGTR